jgi:pimeloyl-ACP methyl ester carboxylesterase
MIAAALGGRGASGYRGRSALYDDQLRAAMHRLLVLGGASAESRTGLIGGRRLHYLEAGAGDPLLLLHGASGGAANWYRLIGPLAERYRVLAPDLPGFGFSDAVDPNSHLGQQIARIVADWLSSMGVTQTKVVGTSFGGLVALRLAELMDTDRIVVTDTVGISSGLPLLLRLATLPIAARLAVSPSRRGTRMLLKHVLTSTPLPAPHEAALTDYLYWSAKRNDVRTMARAFTRFASLRGQRDVLTLDELRAVADRLLVIWGEQDGFLPLADTRQICVLAGCGEVRIIRGAGHSPNWERPDLLLDTIREFLNE